MVQNNTAPPTSQVIAENRPTIDEEAADVQRELEQRERLVAELATYKLTDLGNSQRLVKRYQDRYRYCRPFKAWLRWDGSRWMRD